jgi:hypothetical protein
MAHAGELCRGAVGRCGAGEGWGNGLIGGILHDESVVELMKDRVAFRKFCERVLGIESRHADLVMRRYAARKFAKRQAEHD